MKRYTLIILLSMISLLSFSQEYKEVFSKDLFISQSFSGTIKLFHNGIPTFTPFRGSLINSQNEIQEVVFSKDLFISQSLSGTIKVYTNGMSTFTPFSSAVINSHFNRISIENSENYNGIIIKRDDNGSFIIPCEVYGFNWDFIFDTGATSISISLVEALYLLRHGYINSTNIIGGVNLQIANGDIVEGSIIKLDQIKIAGKSLYNVEAVVVKSLTSPLLLGMNAISQLGVIVIDGDKLIIEDVRFVERKYHIIKSGDTLNGIARLYSTSAKDILYINKGLTATSILQIGQRIRVR